MVLNTTSVIEPLYYGINSKFLIISIIADQSSITNTLALSSYKSFNEDVVEQEKYF